MDQPPSESLAPQATDIPNQSPAEDGPAVVSEPLRKQLPLCQTRGIPKPTYEPKLFSKVKYLMGHYVSNHRFSESNKSFVNQLSTISSPNPCRRMKLRNLLIVLREETSWMLVGLYYEAQSRWYN